MAKTLINKEDLTTLNKQKIYIMVNFDNSQDHGNNSRIGSNFQSTFSPENFSMETNPKNSVVDLKMGIENLRRKIEDEKTNNDKLNIALNNLISNKENYKKKNEGSFIFFIIFS